MAEHPTEIDRILESYRPPWEGINRPVPTVPLTTDKPLTEWDLSGIVDEVRWAVSIQFEKQTEVWQRLVSLSRRVEQLDARDRTLGEELEDLKSRVSRLEEVREVQKETPRVEDKILDGVMVQLGSLYRVMNEDEVRQFVQTRPYLIRPLTEAPEAIYKCFETKPRLFLRLVKDSMDETYRRLFIYIEAELPHEKALDLLDAIGRDWLFLQERDVRTNLNLDLVFV